MDHDDSYKTMNVGNLESPKTSDLAQNSPQNATTDVSELAKENERASIENKVFRGLAAVIVLIPSLVFWAFIMIFVWSCLSQPSKNYHRGQAQVKMEHDPITIPDPDINDAKFELQKWQVDDEGKVRQSMVRDLVLNHTELFMNRPAEDVRKTLGSDAHLWYWAHPSKNDFGCRLAREGLKYQNCIQFTVKNGRVAGYVANVEKVW